MNKVPKRLKALLREHLDRAWEAEMGAALGALGERFDQWRGGALSTADLDAAIHRYHNATARAIWKHYAGDDLEVALVGAVVRGVITRESLPPEVLERIGGLLESLACLDRADD